MERALDSELEDLAGNPGASEQESPDLQSRGRRCLLTGLL